MDQPHGCLTTVDDGDASEHRDILPTRRAHYVPSLP
jgi:hypothetical protein